jgi:hypothetical protein
MVSLVVTVVATLSLSIVMVTSASHREQEGAKQEIAALYAAEAGVARAVFDLEHGGTGDLGTANAALAFDDAAFWVQTTDIGNDLLSVDSTGVDNRGGYRVQVVLREAGGAFFRWGAFGDTSFSMDSNAHVDSYDSGLGTYDSQALNGSGTSKWANDMGNVGSNGNITMDQNTEVHGSAIPGPSSAVFLNGKSTVSGATLPAPEPWPLPPLNIPVYPSSGPLDVPGGGAVTLASGDYHYDHLDIASDGALKVTGPATLVFDDFLMDSNTTFTVDATNGPVEIYVVNDFVLNSNALVSSTTFTPADVSIYLQSDNVIDPDLVVDLDDVELDSNVEIYGTIYAPNASIDINSNFALYGAVVAYELHLDSNSYIHFDEALLNVAPVGPPDYRAMLWRALPFKPDRNAAGYLAPVASK